jgi:hypothetical protein
VTTPPTSSAAAQDVVDADVEKAFYRGHFQSVTPLGSTGWIITPPSGAGFVLAIDVDETTNNLQSVAQATDGRWAWINGHFQVQDIPKRGTTRVVVAESIQAVIE